MSFLETEAGALKDFDKAVISLWFRVPMQSLAACWTKFRAATQFYDFRTMEPPLFSANASFGVIPLFTFGGPTEGPWVLNDVPRFWIQIIDHNLDITYPNGQVATSLFAEMVGTRKYDPSYIGVGVQAVTDTSYRVCVVANIQTSASATITGLYDITGVSQDPVLDGFTSAPAYASYARRIPPVEPDSYTMQLPFVPDDQFVDKWHHLLLSFDVSSPVAASSDAYGVFSGANKLWAALDDVNYEGHDLSPNNYVESGAPNDIVPSNAQSAAFANSPPYNVPAVYLTPLPITDYRTYRGTGHVNIPESNYSPPAAHTYDPVVSSSPPGVIAASKFTIGAPAAGQYSGHVFQCQMAELQMYTGVTLDTSVEANRRLFLTKGGDPVNAWVNIPRAPALEAAKKLKKWPDIMLHKSKWWIAGVSMGQPVTRFMPTGSIKVAPGPKLGT